MTQLELRVSVVTISGIDVEDVRQDVVTALIFGVMGTVRGIDRVNVVLADSEDPLASLELEDLAVVTRCELVTDCDGVWVAIGEDAAGNKLSAVGMGASKEQAEADFQCQAAGRAA